MEYTAFLKGDSVLWNGTKAIVTEDSPSDLPIVKVREESGFNVKWFKVFMAIPVYKIEED